jgi:hypothetical protein
MRMSVALYVLEADILSTLNYNSLKLFVGRTAYEINVTRYIFFLFCAKTEQSWITSQTCVGGHPLFLRTWSILSRFLLSQRPKYKIVVASLLVFFVRMLTIYFSFLINL